MEMMWQFPSPNPDGGVRYSTGLLKWWRYIGPCPTPDALETQAHELGEARAEHAAEVDDLCMTNNRNVEALLRAQRDLARLSAALKPFADEGQKWSGTDPGHDDLKLIVAEDWHVADRIAREATFTIGDLKRAVIALAKEGRP